MTEMTTKGNIIGLHLNPTILTPLTLLSRHSKMSLISGSAILDSATVVIH